MTTRPLDLRVLVAPHQVSILASGDLDAATGHLLCKTVVATLRHHGVACLELDLGDVGELDVIGVCALLDSRREAERRGVLFRLTGVPTRLVRLLRRHGAELLREHQMPARLRHTGTVCR